MRASEIACYGEKFLLDSLAIARHAAYKKHQLQHNYGNGNNGNNSHSVAQLVCTQSRGTYTRK